MPLFGVVAQNIHNSLSTTPHEDAGKRVFRRRYCSTYKTQPPGHPLDAAVLTVCIYCILSVVDEKNSSIRNIHAWTSAFMVYASAMLEKWPTKGLEFLKYIQTVRTAASRGCPGEYLFYKFTIPYFFF
jgi:hypothetical protein